VGDLTLDVSFLRDRVNRPIAGSMSSLPESDDYRTTIALGWSP